MSTIANILLSPMLLGSAPATIKLPEMKYDHSIQQSVVKNPRDIKTAMTFSGTQTFAPNGQPRDADND